MTYNAFRACTIVCLTATIGCGIVTVWQGDLVLAGLIFVITAVIYFNFRAAARRTGKHD